MTRNRGVEIAVGIFVVLGLVALLVLALQVSNLAGLDVWGEDHYEVTARFDNIGGLKERAQVSMAGVQIGRVSRIRFDDRSFQAEVTMRIRGRHDELPMDTTASIYTSGLLGEQYVGLEPGGDEAYLADGDEITFTQSALVLEDLIGQFLYSMGED